MSTWPSAQVYPHPPVTLSQTPQDSGNAASSAMLLAPHSIQAWPVIDGACCMAAPPQHAVPLTQPAPHVLPTLLRTAGHQCGRAWRPWWASTAHFSACRTHCTQTSYCSCLAAAWWACCAVVGQPGLRHAKHIQLEGTQLSVQSRGLDPNAPQQPAHRYRIAWPMRLQWRS